MILRSWQFLYTFILIRKNVIKFFNTKFKMLFQAVAMDFPISKFFKFY
jgi:hypothetical protein